MSAATDILGTPVVEAVPMARSKPTKPVFVLIAMVLAFVVVFSYDLGLVPGPRFPSYFAAPAAVVAALVLGSEQVFAAQTREGGIWMLTGTRMSPRPVAPIGQLNPDHVSAPAGLFGNTFRIAGIKHQVGVQQKARFQRMLAAARVPG